MDGAGLREFITTFFGNIFLAVVGVAAIAFLFKREFVQFASFAVLAIAVGVFLYNPEVIRGIGDAIASTLQ